MNSHGQKSAIKQLTDPAEKKLHKDTCRRIIPEELLHLGKDAGKGFAKLEDPDSRNAHSQADQT